LDDFVKYMLFKLAKLSLVVHDSSVSSNAAGSGRERVLFLLKTKGTQTAARIATELRDILKMLPPR